MSESNGKGAAAAQPQAGADGTSAPSPDILLDVQHLTKRFAAETNFFGKATSHVQAVDDVSFQIRRGEAFGLVGESGCGKTTVGKMLVNLLKPTSGKIVFDGHDLTAMKPAERKAYCKDIQLIFQDPYASLNPRMTVHDTIAEPLLVHRVCARADATARVAELMTLVGLAPRFMQKYPHEFSGGQRQRIAIARALALNPKIIIADVPVSALYVSIQAQILNLLAQLVRRMGLSLIFIAHDLSVVKHISDRVAVMYLGKIVELGPASDVIERPRHPYTRALISAIPTPNPDRERTRKRIVLPGDPPSPINPPRGCAFHPRCPHAQERCQAAVPPLEKLEGSHEVACIRAEEIWQ